MAPIIGIIASGNWAGANASSYYSIATVTVGSGGSSSVDFTSIPSTYSHLQIRMIGKTNRAATNQDDLLIRLGNGSLDTGSNYADHVLRGDGATASANAHTSQTRIGLDNCLGTTTSGVFSGNVIDILDYANTNKYKTVRMLGGFDYNGGGWITLGSGLWMSTSAVDTLRLYANGTFQQYSSFALYGIKS